MSRSQVGPFSADRVLLTRGEGEKRTTSSSGGARPPAELADFALGGRCRRLLRSLIGPSAGGRAEAQIPIRLDAKLKSEGGRASSCAAAARSRACRSAGSRSPIAGAIISRLTG